MKYISFKTLGTLAVSGALALALTGCGKGDPKESFTAAHKKIVEPNSFESSYDFKMKFGGDAKNNPEQKELVDLLENSTFKIDVKQDKKFAEVTPDIQVKTNGTSFGFTSPILVDVKKQALYAKAEDIGAVFQQFNPEFSSALKGYTGKLVVLEANQFGANTTATSASTSNKWLHQELEKIDKEKFKWDGDKVTLTLDGKDSKKLFDSFLKEYKTDNGTETVDAKTLAIQEKALEDAFKITSVTISSEISGDKVVSDNVVFKGSVKEGEEDINFTFTSDTTYKDNFVSTTKASVKASGKTDGKAFSVDVDVTGKVSKWNQDIKFSLDPSKAQTVTYEEVLSSLYGKPQLEPQPKTLPAKPSAK